MNPKQIFTATLLCVTLLVPLSLFSQSQDFEMNGTVLVKYNGNTANVIIPAGVTSTCFLIYYRFDGNIGGLELFWKYGRNWVGHFFLEEF